MCLMILTNIYIDIHPMVFKYDPETDRFVDTNRRKPLLLTPKEKAYIARSKQERQYVVVIVYNKTGKHTIISEPECPNFFAESVEVFLDYICEMSNDLEETVAFVM